MSDEYLDQWIIDAISFIERHHNVTGDIPADNDIIEYLKFTKKYKQGLNSESLNLLKDNELFIKSMESRGLVVNTRAGELRDVDELTSRQMAAASLMINLTDRRSDEKKLRDIGVSTEEFSTWMQNNLFTRYMQQRSEQLVANSVHEAHMGLMRGVKQGNTASIKLYYEMTGRYNPNEEANVNIRVLIGRVLEAIQVHVKDPATLNSLAVSLSQITIEAGGSSPVAKNPFVPDMATRNELL